MSARIDVPTLLRRVQRGAVKGAGDCMCPPVSSGPPYEPCDLCQNVDADAAFLARLSDAVEAWQGARSRQSHDDILAVRRSELAILALLRGEVGS